MAARMLQVRLCTSRAHGSRKQCPAGAAWLPPPVLGGHAAAEGVLCRLQRLQHRLRHLLLVLGALLRAAGNDRESWSLGPVCVDASGWMPVLLLGTQSVCAHHRQVCAMTTAAEPCQQRSAHQRGQMPHLQDVQNGQHRNKLVLVAANSKGARHAVKVGREGAHRELAPAHVVSAGQGRTVRCNPLQVAPAPQRSQRAAVVHVGCAKDALKGGIIQMVPQLRTGALQWRAAGARCR